MKRDWALLLDDPEIAEMLKTITREFNDGPAVAISCDMGWYSLIKQFLTFCKGKDVTIQQIKEKFGRLVVYWSSPAEYDDEISKEDDRVSLLSEKTCETCGKPGKISGSGWLKCKCGNCSSLYLMEIEEIG